MRARRRRRRRGRCGIESLDAGCRVAVVRVEGGRRAVQRLAAIGVVPGAELTVMRPRGPALVRLGQTRIALGPGAMGGIIVEPVD